MCIRDSLSIQPQYMAVFAAAMAIVIAVPFGLTYVIGRHKGVGRNGAEVNGAEVSGAGTAVPAGKLSDAAGQTCSIPSSQPACLTAYVSGQVIPIEEVPDQVFSSKMMGDGIAIEPEDETLLAPADGTVAVVMEDSLHACGLVLDNGMEVLLHIGLDTVDMKGDGFRAFIKPGDRVKRGDKLIQFDRERIRNAGHPDTVIMVVTNMGSVQTMDWKSGIHASAGTDTVAIWNERTGKE